MQESTPHCAALSTQGILQEAVKNCEYGRLRDNQGKPPGLLGWWPGKAITFVDNHDTVRQDDWFTFLCANNVMLRVCIPSHHSIHVSTKKPTALLPVVSH